MEIQKDIPLGPHTSFFIGGPAKYFCEVSNIDDLIEGIDFARKQELEVFLLGGGSNILVSDNGFNGLVIKIVEQGIKITKETDSEVFLEIAAGQSWDSVVQFAVEKELWGIENLSHIPGNCGAFAVQNVGAYGQEASQTLTEVKVCEKSTGEIKSLTNSECGFEYRASIFNREQKGEYIILGITLLLRKSGKPNLIYGDLTDYFRAKTEGDISLVEIRDAIIEIRNRKYPFPVSPETGSAGSFFRGPLISRDEWKSFEQKISKNFGSEVTKRLEGMKTRLEVPQGFKTPSAFLIEICGFKGLQNGGALVNPAQGAVILNTGTATSANVLSLFKRVCDGVYEKTGITLEHEPEFVGF